MAIDNKTKAVFDKFFSKRATIESPSDEEKKNMHEEETAIDEPVTKTKKCCEGKSRLSENDRKKLLKMLNLSKAYKKEACEEDAGIEKEALVYAGGGRVGLTQAEWERLDKDKPLANAFFGGKKKDMKAYEAAAYDNKATKLSRRQFDKQRLNFVLDSKRKMDEGKIEGDAVDWKSPYFMSKLPERASKRERRKLDRALMK